MRKTLFATVALVTIITLSMLLASCVTDEPVLRDEDFVYRNYGVRFNDVGFTVTPINAEIAQGNDVAAALHLLDVVHANMLAADYLASASVGGGSASSSLFDMCGSLQFGDIYIRDNGAFYSQSVARVTEANSSSPVDLLKLAQALLDQSDRKYSPDGETFYVQKAKGSKAVCRMIEDYPFGSSDFSTGSVEVFTLAQYMEEEFIYRDYRELSNFVFTADTILADSVSITYEDGLYTLNFEVNLEDTSARDIATEYARANMREAATSTDLEYALYKVTLEIWDNGLIRKYTKEESWAATLSIGPLKPNGASHSITSIYYSWDPADCTFSGNNIDISWAQ